MICMFVRATIELTLTSAHVRCALQELQQQPLGGRPGRLGPALVVAAGRTASCLSRAQVSGGADQPTRSNSRCVSRMRGAASVGVGAVTHSASPTCHNFVSRVMRSRNPAIKVYLSNISGRTFTRHEKCITVRLGASDPNTMDCGDPGAHALYLSWHRREHIQRLRTHARHEDGPNRMCVRRGATRERGGRHGAARQPVSVGSHLSSAGMCASREAWCDDRRTSRRRRLSRKPRRFPPRRPG